MVEKAVPDEYYERYSHFGHDELHRQLRAGSPKRVAAVAHAWQVAQDAMESLAAALRADLARLAGQWQSPGGREFQYRIDVVRAYAQRLGEEAAAIRNGLTVMSAALGQAQHNAEPPRPTLLVASPDGVLDAAFGHVMSAEEQARAEQRMVALVAALAAEYGLADHGSWPATMPEPPPDLPGTGPAAVDSALTAVGAVAMPATLSGPTPGEGTELAGAGHLAAGSPGMVSTAEPAPTSAPAATLSGALPGLSGSLGYRPAADGTPATPATDAPARGGTVPPPIIGAGGPGDAARGYAITDPRLADDGAGASGRDLAGWHGSDDVPPAVLGGSD